MALAHNTVLPEILAPSLNHIGINSYLGNAPQRVPVLSGFGHTPLGRELGEQLLQMHHWAEHWQQRRQKPESS